MQLLAASGTLGPGGLVTWMSEALAAGTVGGQGVVRLEGNATVNGAKVLGLDEKIGRVRAGFGADLLVINGNPLENLRVMNPYGTDLMTLNGQVVNSYSSSVKPSGTLKFGR